MKTPINPAALAVLFNVPFTPENFGASNLLQNGTDRQRVDQAVTLMRVHPEMRPFLREFLSVMNLTDVAREYCVSRHIDRAVLEVL